MAQIDWVRATFAGTIIGGFLWAVIIGLASADSMAMGWQARTAVIAVGVNAAVLAISWLLWRSAADDKGRTRAAALWIVPFLGIAFFAAIAILGAGAKLAGS